ncbi:cytochrome C prime [Microvirga sp. KLBC 81]|uniref:c-type cytochrome n=1 Tax=Microvirga sp. KLBC 81 TaxID=1862707 RepID=UPI000D5153EE|nr:cytochrome c [Microvirga sp. KLBC 81]PVE22373.1 cytochrome C prime [Microvirga sp. KLBC 81]
MRPAVIAAITVSMVSGFGVWAQQGDPIRQRQELMKSNQEQVRLLSGMSRGQVPFNATQARAALQRIEQNAQQIPMLFPANSQQGKTDALPVIWERKADFDARATKLEQDAKAAQTAITDQTSLQGAIQRVGQNCGGCHETYRKKET